MRLRRVSFWVSLLASLGALVGAAVGATMAVMLLVMPPALPEKVAPEAGRAASDGSAAAAKQRGASDARQAPPIKDAREKQAAAPETIATPLASEPGQDPIRAGLAVFEERKNE